MPTRTLQDWKKAAPENWRKKVYEFLKQPLRKQKRISLDLSKIGELKQSIIEANLRADELYFKGKDKTEYENKELEFLHKFNDKMSFFTEVRI